MEEITVDYEVLEAQRRRFEDVTCHIADPLLDGLHELLTAIIEQKPFREVKDIKMKGRKND